MLSVLSAAGSNSRTHGLDGVFTLNLTSDAEKPCWCNLNLAGLRHVGIRGKVLMFEHLIFLFQAGLKMTIF